jgi:hypothetical protein
MLPHVPVGVLQQQNALEFVDQLAASGGVGGILFHYAMPTDQAGAYTPTKDDAQVLDSDITEALSATPSATLSADGYLNFGAQFKQLQLINVGAKTTSTRKYTLLVDSGAVSTNTHSAILKFNKVDASNEWQVKVSWLTAAGNFDILLLERTAGVDTLRATATLPSNIDTPALLLVEVFDFGDRVTLFASAYETDSLADVGSAEVSYSVASRPHQNATRFEFGSWTGTTYSFRSIMVEDL